MEITKNTIGGDRWTKNFSLAHAHMSMYVLFFVVSSELMRIRMECIEPIFRRFLPLQIESKCSIQILASLTARDKKLNSIFSNSAQGLGAGKFEHIGPGTRGNNY